MSLFSWKKKEPEDLPHDFAVPISCFSNFAQRRSFSTASPMVKPSTNNVSRTADIHMNIPFNTVLSYNAFLSSQMHNKIWNYQDFDAIAYPDARGQAAENSNTYTLTDNASMLFHYVCHKNSPWRAKNLVAKRNDYARICLQKLEKVIPRMFQSDGSIDNLGTNFLTVNGFILAAMEFNEYLRPGGGGPMSPITEDQIVDLLGQKNFLVQVFGLGGVRKLWSYFLQVGRGCYESLDYVRNPIIPFSALVNQDTQFATCLWLMGVLCRKKEWVIRAINAFLTFEQCMQGGGAFAYIGKQNDVPNYHYIIARLYFILDYLVSSPTTHKTLKNSLYYGKGAANRKVLKNLSAAAKTGGLVAGGGPQLVLATTSMSADEVTARQFFLGPLLQGMHYYPTTIHTHGLTSEYSSPPAWKHYWALADYLGVRYATTFMVAYHTQDVYNLSLSKTSFSAISFENSLLYPIFPVVATDKVIKYVSGFTNPMTKTNLGYYSLNFIKPYANKIRTREIELMGQFYIGVPSDFIAYDVNIDGVRSRTPLSDITFIMRDPAGYPWDPSYITKSFPLAGVGTQNLAGFMSLTHDRQNRWYINGALDSICFGYMIPLNNTQMEYGFPDLFRWVYISRNAFLKGGANILAPVCATMAITHNISAKVKTEGSVFPKSPFDATQVWMSLPAKGYASSSTASYSLAGPTAMASSLSCLLGVFCVTVTEETCVHDARLFLNMVSARDDWGIPKFIEKVYNDPSDPFPTYIYTYADLQVLVKTLKAPKKIESRSEPHPWHDIENPRPVGTSTGTQSVKPLSEGKGKEAMIRSVAYPIIQEAGTSAEIQVEEAAAVAVDNSYDTMIDLEMVQQVDKFYTWGVSPGNPKPSESFSLGLRQIDFSGDVASRPSMSLPASGDDFTFIFQVEVVKDENIAAARNYTKVSDFPTLKFRQPQPGLILLNSHTCTIVYNTGKVAGAIDISDEVTVSDSDSWMSSADPLHISRSTATGSTFPMRVSPNEHITILRGQTGYWLDCQAHVFPSVQT